MQQAMRIFSVAMKGSSAMTCARMTCGQTWRPSVTLATMLRITSTAKKASGRMMRRMLESSSVRSNHCVACVCAAVAGSAMT